jgi:hypothetical protein
MSGEVIDISFIPAQTTLEAAKISNEFSDGKITMDEMFSRMIGVIVDVSEGSNPKVTTEWVLKNVSVKKMTRFLELLVSDVNESKEEAGEPAKN